MHGILYFIQLITFWRIFDHTVKSYDVKTFTTVRINLRNPYILFCGHSKFDFFTFIIYPPEYLVYEKYIRGN